MTLSPNCVVDGTAISSDKICNSPGSNEIEVIGLPIGEAKVIPLPHAVLPYVIPVSVSSAFPRFSMTIHACAVEPGIPHPVV